jgi:hypothetical protein
LEVNEEIEMSFAWPTTQQALYRVMRLRRLIAFTVVIPMAVVMTIALMDPAALSAANATLASLGIAALVVGHVVLFPNVTLETIALSLSATFLVILMPLIKVLSLWAPVEQASGAFVILLGFAVAVMGVAMALFQIILGALVYAGPAVRKTLNTTLFVPCSPTVAFQQFALRPQSRRGRVLTGPVDENGFFDVAVAVSGFSDGEGIYAPQVVKLDAKVLSSSADRHDVMMVLRNGSVTVTSQKFVATKEGCDVQVCDMPGDFTVGMHALFWLTDQQADNLTETADSLIGQVGRTNGMAHNASLMAVAGTILSPRAPVSNHTE